MALLPADMTANTLWTSPREAATGLGIMATGISAYLCWSGRETEVDEPR